MIMAELTRKLESIEPRQSFRAKRAYLSPQIVEVYAVQHKNSSLIIKVL